MIVYNLHIGAVDYIDKASLNLPINFIFFLLVV